jgi:hypothetical protein
MSNLNVEVVFTHVGSLALRGCNFILLFYFWLLGFLWKSNWFRL